MRVQIGAYMNRLEHTIEQVATSAENVTAAESRIRDTDMAKEMMQLTKQQLFMQSSMAMMSQANQHPSMVLQLL